MDGFLTKKLCFTLIFGLVFTSGCNTHRFYHTKSTTQKPKRTKKIKSKKDVPTVTIWVHGTRSASKLLFPNFFRSIQGIQHASAYDEENNLLKIAKTLSKSDPTEFCFDNIFFHGWNGKLSCRERYAAAVNLRDSILSIINHFVEKYGVKPKIRLITHSHGGNVALYLALVQKDLPTKIVIDELIMLACPVQKTTMHLIKDPMFERIYSFYSKRDIIQRLDPQGLFKKDTPFFSGRTFPEQENLLQIEVRMNGWFIIHPHLQFVLTKFLSNLPRMLADLKDSKKRKKLPEKLVCEFSKKPIQVARLN